MNALRALVRRPVAAWMVAAALAVLGLVSWRRLPLELMPDLAWPALTVRTELPGAAPEEVEDQVARPVEEAVATTRGLVSLESRSRAGAADVVLRFAWGTDMDEAVQSVRENLQLVDLPDDARRPLILRTDPNRAPVLRVALAPDPDADRPADPAALRRAASHDLQRVLEAMEGVAAVRVQGGDRTEVRVETREAWLAAARVTIDDIVAALRENNVNVPGGDIWRGDERLLVRTLAEARSLDEIADISVRRADGTRVRLGDVATVREAHADRRTTSRLDGREAVEIEVHRAADANVVRLAREVRRALGIDGDEPDPAVERALPEGARIVLLEDRSRFVEAALANLRSTALVGALLAVGVLFLFLRDLRATAIVAAAIPLSVVWTFTPMHLGGVSLNLLSLGGLALGVGMLVDNSVVVLENIQVHIERGEERADAAAQGTAEVAAAVVASTLTTVSVFLPIAFVEGIAGRMFGDLALAVVMSLLASLGVAVLFVPVLAARNPRRPDFGGRLRDAAPSVRLPATRADLAALRRLRGRRALLAGPWIALRTLLLLPLELATALAVLSAGALARALVLGAAPPLRLAHAAAQAAADRFGGAFAALARRYDGWIARALDRPGAVLGGAALAVALALALVPALGRSLLPEFHQGRLEVEVVLPVGTPLARTDALVHAAEDALLRDPDVVHVHAVAGTEGGADARPDEGEHSARLGIELRPGAGRAAEERAAARVRAAIDEAARSLALEPEVRVGRPRILDLQPPIEAVVYGEDLGALRAAADRVAARLAALPGLRDVRSSLVSGYPEVRIRYDRRLLRRLGLDPGSVARAVRAKVQGEIAGDVPRGERRVDLVVRLAEPDRAGLDELARINVNPALVPPVPLGSVARLEVAEGPSEVRRVGRRRAAVVTAEVDGLDVAGAARSVEAALSGLDLGGLDWEVAGQARELRRSAGSLAGALALALFLVYVIMAGTFESLLHPFVILLSVPLAAVGVVAALFVLRVPLSVVVFLGLIVLVGVVVNNAIVLVDTVNRLRAAGLPRTDAIRQGAALRLRPILITTATTVLGLLPLALGIGRGAEMQQPLAITLIAGLTSSTLLTLVVVPVLYRVLTGIFEGPDEARGGGA